jgi:hypothetical protein
MHIEIFVEDHSGKIFTETLLRKFFNNEQTWKVTPFHGLGHLPEILDKTPDPIVKDLLHKWAKDSTAYMDVNNDRSPGFNYFREKLIECFYDED